MRLTPGRQTRPSSLVTSIRHSNLSALISALICLTVVGYLATNFASSKAPAPRPEGEVTVHAAGRGNPWINLQDGRDLATVYKGRNVAQALLWNAANPLTLASADFDEDGVADLVVGYGGGSGGALSIYRGNINAFAPQTEEAWRAVTEMRYPDPFFPEARTVTTLLQPQFLGTGDFNSDGHRDLLLAAQGSNIIELCLGDGRGNFAAADLRYLPGSVTTMLTDDIGATDGLTDLVVGVVGASGPAILVYSGKTTLSSEPATYPLSKPATALASGRLGKDGTVEIVAAAENEIAIVHDADRQEAARVERFNLSFKTIAITMGRFIWDREGSQGVAVLGDDGAVHLLTAGRLDTRPFTQDEIASIRDNRFKYGADSVEFRDFLKTLVHRPDESRDWLVAESVPTGVSEAGNNSSRTLLIKAGVSAGLVDDLAVVDSGNNKLHVIRNRQVPTVPDKSSAQAETNAAQTPVDIPLDVEGAPVAVLSMRLNVDTLPDLVVLRQGQKDPGLVITAPLSTYVVNSTTDAVDASPGNNVCATGGAVCTLRAAIMESNHHVGPDAITLPAGTYQLTIINPAVTPSGDNERLLTQGGHEEYADLDIIDFDGDDTQRSDLTINGAAPGTTFVQAGTTATNGIDRVFDINNAKVSQGDKAIAVTINNVTVRFGIGQVVDVPATTNDILQKGAGIQFNGFTLIGTAGPTTLALTLDNCVVTSNTASGLGGGIHSEAGSLTIQNGSIVSNNSCNGGAGGGVDYAGGNTYIGQALTITNSTIGGAGAGNSSTPIPVGTPYTNQGPLSGGGVATFGGSAVTITGSTIQANVSNDATGAGSSQQNTGGGGLFFTGNPVVTITGSTITGNTAKNNGGGIYAQLVQSLTNAEGTATINNTQITSNTADSDTSGVGNGGGIYNHRGAITIGNATLCNINSNTAADGGGIYLTWNLQTNDLPPSVTMTNGTLNTNNARNNGGGIAVNFEATTADASNKTATTTLTGVTLQSNTANSDSAGGGDGGGIFDNGNGGTFSMPVSLSGVTIDSNVANSGLGDGLRLNGGTMSNSGTINVNGGDSIYLAGGTFNSTSGTYNLTGNFTRDSANTFNANGGTFNFNGSGPQAINGTATSDTFNNFIVNKSGGALTVGGSTTTVTTNDLTMTLGSFTAPALLDINGNLLLNGGTLTAGTNITAAGNWTNNGGTFTPGAGTVTFDGAGPQSINGTAVTQTFNNFTVNKGGGTLSTSGSTTSLIMNNLTMTLGTFTAPATLDINGNTLLSAGTLTAGANITAAGNWTNNGGTFTPGAGLVTFDGATANTLGGTAATQTFNNFTVAKGAGSLTGVASTTTLNLNGAMTLTSGTFAAGTITAINLPGNWTNNGGTFTPGSSNVTFNSTTAPQSITGTAASQTFFSITMNKTGQTLNTAGSTTALDLDGSLVLTAGTFTAPATMTIGGNFTQATGTTFTPGAGIVTFDGGGAQSIDGTLVTKTFNNFTVSKGGGTLSGAVGTTALDINGNLSITAGTFAAGTATSITVFGNWANTGTFTGGAGTVTFDGNNNTQSLTGSTTFNNLTILHTGTGTVDASGSTLAVSALLRIQSGTFISSSTFNNVQIDSGQTLQGTNLTTMNVSGNWTNNGGTFTPNGNTVNFNGAGAQSISGTSTTQTFNNFSKSNAGTLSVAASTTTLDINGNVNLTGGNFTAGTATAITVAGNWTNSGGAFTAGAGTVTFDGGAPQTIGGTTATTFNNLTIANSTGVSLGQNETVSGLLTLNFDLTTGANTLTMPVAATSGPATNAADVIGNVKRTGFVSGGAALSFGNPFNTIRINSGAAPADINVNLVKASPAGFSSSVQRTYTITPNGANGQATLRLHYLDSELNGNTPETSLNLRRFNGTGWQPFVATASSTGDALNNWVENNAVSTFSAWTFSTFTPTATNGVVSGRITTSDGTGVEGAVVRLAGTQNRKFITDANGFYRFDNVETDGFYTVTPSRVNYTFNPATRSFSQLGQITEAAFGATLASGGFSNPLDTPEYFVRQHYLDFLDREPDEAGFNFWSDQMLSCGNDTDCLERRRINVSAAYFLSIEFQQTGGLVDGLYRVSYERRPLYGEFVPDRRSLAHNVVVGRQGWEQQLEANKQSFIAAFVQRSAFINAYGNLTDDAYVDSLISHTGVSFTPLERAALVNGLTNGTTTRAGVLRQIAENQRFEAAKFSEAFVTMEYLGYLLRDPDVSGFDFWLTKLNQFNGNFEQAEMVKAFIVSGEYRDRFPR